MEEFVLEARPSILPVRALLQVALAGLLDDAALLHHRQLFLLDTALECLQSPEVFCDVGKGAFRLPIKSAGMEKFPW